MECPKCKFTQPQEGPECIKCGIVFSKYVPTQTRQGNAGPVITSAEEDIAAGPEGEQEETLFRALFLHVPETNAFAFAGRVLLFLLIAVWGLRFIFTPMESNYVGESFLHLVNLPFHEAGHLFFGPFGRLIGALGGSLMQLLIPLICLLTFLLKTRDTFGASVSLWWMAESMMDLAPYINDARALRLILLGGVTGRDVDDYHDWEFILRKLGLLRYDHLLAQCAFFIGIFLMSAAILWGGVLLFKQFRNIRAESPF